MGKLLAKIDSDGALLFGGNVAGQFVESGPQFLSGVHDPSSGGGEPAAVGSIYLRTSGGAGTTLYYKADTADTDWTAVS